MEMISLGQEDRGEGGRKDRAGEDSLWGAGGRGRGRGRGQEGQGGRGGTPWGAGGGGGEGEMSSQRQGEHPDSPLSTRFFKDEI